MLMLNGTWVGTGKRIVASDVFTASDGERTRLPKGANLFRDAFDLHALLWSKDQDCKTTEDVHEDIRLSTGITMTARFPVISPHGTIKNKCGTIVDRVVDGGYFENYGATTIRELAEELKTYNLKPFIILVNNEPMASNMDCSTLLPLAPLKGVNPSQLSKPRSTLFSARGMRVARSRGWRSAMWWIKK